jgi:hypothetical protein
MKTLGIAALALSILSASVSVTMAQGYASTPRVNDNGINGQTHQDRTAYEGYYNPQKSTVTQPQSANLSPYYTDHTSARE